MKSPELNQQLNYKDYIEGTQTLLDQSQHEQEPYTTKVLDREYVALNY